MRHLLLFLLLSAWCANVVFAQSLSTVTIAALDTLDDILERNAQYERGKCGRIELLRKNEPSGLRVEELYWHYKRMYDEFTVFDTDSAMRYAVLGEELARRLGREDWVAECRIARSHVFSAMGLLKEASDVLRGVGVSGLPCESKASYYAQMAYLTSHFAQYAGDEDAHSPAYYRAEKAYNDSLYAATPEGSLAHLWYKGWKYRGTALTDSVRRELEAAMAHSDYDTHNDAKCEYLLAHLCKDAGDDDSFVRHLAQSAMADIRIANRDIASLEELTMVVFGLGDIDRAYAYGNHCLRAAQAYSNRIRLTETLKALDTIHKAAQERDRELMRGLRRSLWTTAGLATLLVVALSFICWQVRRLKRRRRQLDEVNSSLADHVALLGESRAQLKGTNEKLHELNGKLQENNAQLSDANYIKEEYIGYVFALCSTYISKMDDFRKSVNRKIRCGQVQDLLKQTETPIAKRELHDFYANFDMVFLKVFPSFVADINGLLRPEERIVLRDGELLNTDLRIYALVRLGINNNVKIADFLHCSPQTIYNNRLKMRNKSVVPKEEFALRVRNLGRKAEEGAVC